MFFFIIQVYFLNFAILFEIKYFIYLCSIPASFCHIVAFFRHIPAIFKKIKNRKLILRSFNYRISALFIGSSRVELESDEVAFCSKTAITIWFCTIEYGMSAVAP